MRSLTARLAIYLVAAQFLGFGLTLLLMQFLVNGGVLPIWEGNWNDLASARSVEIVAQSIVRASDGELRVEPNAALLAEIRRVPTLRFAAFDPNARRLLPGSDSSLATMFEASGSYRLLYATIRRAENMSNGSSGFVSPMETPFGSMEVAVYGFVFSWKDIGRLASENFSDARFHLPGFLFATAIAWLVLRRALRPLDEAARGAERIDLDSLDQKLPIADLPTEFRPLVASINRALERLDDSAARQKRFLANAAHELRTPVAILEARLDHFDVPTVKNDLRRDARRIRVIVEQLLASARLDRTDRAKTETVDVIGICQAVVDDFALLAVRQGKEIEFQAQASRFETPGDARALESVIANLVDNALRAEPQGGTVIVRLTPDRVIEVIDHGAGIAEQEREMIFEPFWRKSGSATSGTGLGLCIVKEIMEKLKGRVWAEETPGGGVTFKLSFSAIGSAPISPDCSEKIS